MGCEIGRIDCIRNLRLTLLRGHMQGGIGRRGNVRLPVPRENVRGPDSPSGGILKIWGTALKIRSAVLQEVQ